MYGDKNGIHFIFEKWKQYMFVKKKQREESAFDIWKRENNKILELVEWVGGHALCV